ncbi:YihY/virulence factor BrkB family protein [Pantanalinema rosaneae CENA516]|uniref:YihY/virulence factor BrkB family protein n=1 Tax=Pantanalinema rosaneae TaxID=1620701 RepID=UPI003D6E16F1
MRVNRFFRFFRYLNMATLREVIVRSGQQRLPGLAAEIAFNATLAMFPAIVSLLTAIGMLGSSQRAFDQLINQLGRVSPDEVLALIQGFIQEISPYSSQSLFSISFIASIWIASAAISAAMNALDQIHQIPAARRRSFWQAKLVSLMLTIGTLLLMLVASITLFVSDWIVQLVASQSDQLVETIAKRPNVMEPQLLQLWQRLSLPLALGLVALAFGFIYRFGISRWQPGTPILSGAVLSTISWALLSSLFRLYIRNFGSYNRIYGALGAVMILLVWLQLGALMMLIGAQLNAVVGEAMRRQKPTLA